MTMLTYPFTEFVGRAIEAQNKGAGLPVAVFTEMCRRTQWSCHDKGDVDNLYPDIGHPLIIYTNTSEDLFE